PYFLATNIPTHFVVCKLCLLCPRLKDRSGDLAECLWVPGSCERRRRGTRHLSPLLFTLEESFAQPPNECFKVARECCRKSVRIMATTQYTMNKLDILVFAAHPDDAELCCGGTIAKLIQQGKSVGIIDMTRGEMGTRGTP